MHLPVLHGTLVFPWLFLHSSRLEFQPYPSPNSLQFLPATQWLVHPYVHIHSIHYSRLKEAFLGQAPQNNHLDTIIQPLCTHLIQNHTRQNYTKRLSILSGPASPKAKGPLYLVTWDYFGLRWLSPENPHALLIQHLPGCFCFRYFFLLQMIIKQICNYPGLLCILSRDRYYLTPGHSGAPFLSRNTTDCSEITLAWLFNKIPDTQTAWDHLLPQEHPWAHFFPAC